uniref:Peptidase aspartic putative domain-containing protein n=1 Tax=Phlebotomus papatasi TaxID=29031 RepID=A0A1B0GNN0_PHLPP
MSVDERFETVKSLKLCRNCLASHQTSSCTFHKCNRCKGRHNILLHEKFVNSSNNGSPRDANDSSGSGNSKSPSDSNADSHPSPTTVAISSVPSDSCATQPPKVFLATAMVDILNANQERIQCRMVLDSGAQICLVEVLKGAGFVLTKWMSNNQLLTPLHTSDSARDSVILQDTTTSVLGLTWDSKLDSFHFSAPISPSDVVHSKRDIASAIAKLFDPIGLVGPVIIEAKMLLQHLHSIKPKNPDKKSVKNSWDAPLPAEFLLRWKKFVEAFQEVRHISIPRWISTISNPTRVDLHIFCDASAKAYGAVIYYVSRDSCGNVCSRILMAKSRVAPLKEITIPRLELCGALLSAEMMHKVKPILNPTNVHYWTDSSIVLSWLNTPPDSYKLFVARRITHILKLSKAPQWRHVPTKDNPADVISRGCTPSQLASTILWWNGPPWLTEDESSWPTIFRPGSNVHDDVTCLAMVPDPAWHEVWMSRHSRLTTIKHVMAYILRFVNNTTPAKDKQFGSMLVHRFGA